MTGKYVTIKIDQDAHKILIAIKRELEDAGKEHNTSDSIKELQRRCEQLKKFEKEMLEEHYPLKE